MGAGDGLEPMLFTEFLGEIGVETERGQRALCRVAFDGAQPRDLPAEERAWARDMFGDLDEISPLALMVICVVAGGRSGKTYLFSLRLLHIGLTIDLSHLAAGEEAFGAIIAPTLELAGQSLRYVAGVCRKFPALAAMIVADNKTELILRREDGNLIAIRCFAAAAGGLSGRGKSLFGLLLDETCFFKDKETGAVNDQAIFDAASVRVMDGGQTMVGSTPWLGRGLLYDIWRKWWGKKNDDYLVAHAPTRLMRTKEHILNLVTRAERKDPDNACVEFGAQWGSASTSLFFTEDELASAFPYADDERPPARVLSPGEKAAAGGDLGFVNNAAELAVLHEDKTGIAHLVETKQHKALPGKPLKPSAVCEDFAQSAAAHGCTAVAADGHYRETFREHTDRAGIELMDGPGTTEALVALRTRIREGKAKLWGDRLRRHLAGIKQKRTVGDNIKCVLPEDLDGSHADDAVAVANAAWLLSVWGGETKEEPPKEETWNDKEKAARIRALHERERGRGQERPRWR